jgi:hypothetical protein
MSLGLSRMGEVVMKVASVLGALCFLAVCSGSAAEVNSQQQAVARLKSERNMIVNCAVKLKTHGNPAQRVAGAEAYQNAKAKIDEVFRVLAANLAEGSGSVDAGALEDKIQASIKQRIDFCEKVEQLGPPTRQMGPKTRQIFLDVYADTLKPTMEAVKWLLGRKTADESERRAINTQLEAAKWPEYSDIRPAR